jgi:hypothetical protein
MTPIDYSTARSLVDDRFRASERRRVIREAKIETTEHRPRTVRLARVVRSASHTLAAAAAWKHSRRPVQPHVATLPG